MQNMLLRYTTFLISILVFVLSVVFYDVHESIHWLLIISALLIVIGIHDIIQTKSSILRNYPILAHFRFLFELIRPEIRQYFLEDDTSANPFSRNQRSIVYQRAKQQIDKTPKPLLFLK